MRRRRDLTGPTLFEMMNHWIERGKRKRQSKGTLEDMMMMMMMVMMNNTSEEYKIQKTTESHIHIIVIYS